MRFVLLATASLAAAPLAAQAAPAPAPPAEVPVRAEPAEQAYRREVFSYPRGGRPDPFRSLMQDAELGVRFQDLTLRGVIYNPEGGRSVAVLWDEANKRRIRGRVGERIGSVTIVAITPRRVDLVIEEFGVARRESLQLTAQPQTGTES